MVKVESPGFLLDRILAPALHQWPFLGGVLRLSNHPIVWKAIAQAPIDVMAKLRNGVRLRVSLGDFDGRMLYLFGRPDPRVVELVLTLAQPGDVFFDIGANYGAVGFLVSDAVGASGAVHLFEPQPELCVRIREAMSAASRPWIHLHACGVLDEDGELELWQTPGHTGVASFAGTPAKGAIPVRVPVRDIRQLMPGLAHGRTWAAKVDVEGVEMRILPALLTIPGMRFLVAESSHLEAPAKLWNVVRANGQSIFGIAKSSFQSRLEPIKDPEAIVTYEDVLIARMRGRAPQSPVGLKEIAASIASER